MGLIVSEVRVDVFGRQDQSQGGVVETRERDVGRGHETDYRRESYRSCGDKVIGERGKRFIVICPHRPAQTESDAACS